MAFIVFSLFYGVVPLWHLTHTYEYAISRQEGNDNWYPLKCQLSWKKRNHQLNTTHMLSLKKFRILKMSIAEYLCWNQSFFSPQNETCIFLKQVSRKCLPINFQLKCKAMMKKKQESCIKSYKHNFWKIDERISWLVGWFYGV